MPKGKTGNPRGRPRGTREAKSLIEEAIYYALWGAIETGALRYPGKPSHKENLVTKLAKLLADPETEIAGEQLESWAKVGITPADRLGPEQFKNRVQDSVQRRRGTKGEDHYLDGEAGHYVRETALLVADILAAQQPRDVHAAVMALGLRGWPSKIITRLCGLSLVARKVQPPPEMPWGN